MPRRSARQASEGRPEEQAFLQSIVDRPGDGALWLILADWLEENDDPRRAELLRLHRQLLTTCCQPKRHTERAEQQARIVRLLTEGVRPCVPRQTLRLARRVEMTFAWIPPGSFLMGSLRSEKVRDGDERQHRVNLAAGFWLAVTPVTQGQWRATRRTNPSHFKGKDLPVENVSWDDCQEFCLGLSEKTGRTIRLPREAQWEYACRAGTTTPFFFGETISPEQANYDGHYPYGDGTKGPRRRKTTAVGSFPPNAWGLYDMHGNVWEWCQDRYDADYAGSHSEEEPPGPEDRSPRVLHGGCWDGIAGTCRSAERLEDRPTDHEWRLGFRVAIR